MFEKVTGDKPANVKIAKSFPADRDAFKNEVNLCGEGRPVKILFKRSRGGKGACQGGCPAHLRRTVLSAYGFN